MEKFWIEKSEMPVLKGQLFLKTEGAAWCVESVKDLLGSKTFKSHNPQLIPIFERAKEMMDLGETGDVIVKS